MNSSINLIMPHNKPLTEQKLRKACDACNLSKVRCSRGRPSCDRCASQGVKCIYGVSMRSGKHPASSSNIQKPKPKTPPSPSPTTPDAPSPFPDRRTHSFDSATLNLNDSMLMSGNPTSNLTDDFNRYMMSNGMDLDNNNHNNLNNSSNQGLPESFFDTGFLAQPSDYSIDPSDLMKQDFFSSPHPFASTNNDNSHEDGAFTPSVLTTTESMQSTPASYSTSPVSTSTNTTTSPYTCNCTQLVSRETLTISKAAPNNPGFPMVNTHQTLSQNKAIIRLCHSVLGCQEHPTDDISLILTLAALIAKVIEAYDSMHQQLRWDEYQIEFSNVIALVRAFEQRVCRPGGPLEKKGECETKVCGDMVNYLQKRVQASL